MDYILVQVYKNGIVQCYMQRLFTAMAAVLGFNLDSIQNDHLLCRLPPDEAQWKQHYLDGCKVDSIRGSIASRWIPTRVTHLLCGLHLEVAQQKQQHVHM
jgi:hypothetical protein